MWRWETETREKEREIYGERERMMLVWLKHQIQPYLKLETPPPPPRYVSNVSNMSHEFPFLFMAVRVTALPIHSCKSPEYFLHTQTITCTNYSLGFHCKSNWRLTVTRMPRKSVVRPVLSSLCSRLRGFAGLIPLNTCMEIGWFCVTA